MIATPMPRSDGELLRDPVTEITGRIERSRSRLRRERCAARGRASGEAVYTLFDRGEPQGIIRAPRGEPAFGPGEAALLLTREKT